MAKLVFSMSQSLDGYVDHLKLGPPPQAAFRHFVEHMRGLAGCIYGRGLYEIMRYWDDDLPGWDADDHEFAQAWRRTPKWVVSRTLQSVGPNATLVADDVEAAIRALKAGMAGELEVGGPVLAQNLTGLIDEYRLGQRQPVLRRCPAAAPSGGQRSHCRGSHPADLRAGMKRKRQHDQHEDCLCRFT
ncbi:MAG TPA: hypothetical protein VGF97_15260 [Rhizomicrobium sp.]|jgi:dihydrofolate reductase